MLYIRSPEVTRLLTASSYPLTNSPIAPALLLKSDNNLILKIILLTVFLFLTWYIWIHVFT